jgi:hypothetical protein
LEPFSIRSKWISGRWAAWSHRWWPIDPSLRARTATQCSSRSSAPSAAPLKRTSRAWC